MVVLCFINNDRLIKKRFRQPVARIDEALQALGSKRIRDNEEAVRFERLPLLWFEFNEIHAPYPFLMTQPCCISLLAGGKIVACGKSVFIYFSV